MSGMKYHDLAKPFFLGGPHHSIAGFLLLTTAGKKTEALYALLHHGHRRNRKSKYPWFPRLTKLLMDWTQLTNSYIRTLKVPYWVLLSPWIDQIAASTYSGLEADPKLEIWSIQNPFSRLPQLSKDIKTYGNQKEQEEVHKSLWGNQKEREEVHKSLWSNEKLESVHPWKDMSKFLKGGFENLGELVKLLSSLAAGKTQIKEYVGAFSRSIPHVLFPERTYPAANDTALLEHGRLTAALALVVAGNMIHGETFKTTLPKITLQKTDEKLLLNGKAVDSFEEKDWDVYRDLVADNLRCLLVRISFKGFEHLFEQGVRLDDIHGVWRFLGEPGNTGQMTYRELFKKEFAKVIANLIGDLSIEKIFEPLNDFAFDLIYLLPASFGEDHQFLREKVREASDNAARKISEDLAKRFEQDFDDIKDIQDKPVKVPKPDRAQIDLEIKNLASFCFIQPVEVKPDFEKFEEFKKNFADELSKKYQALLDENSIPIIESIERIKIDDTTVEKDSGEVCDVCRIHVPFMAFYQFYEEQPEDIQEQLRKVMFDHKEEEERLCSFCLCLRVLSHSTVQEEWLTRMLDHDRENGMVRRQPSPDGLDPPPSLLSGCLVEAGKRNPVDMGACFVRSPNANLEVFPTLYCAADANSNIVLLQLEPSRSILGPFNYRKEVESLRDIEYKKLDGKIKHLKNVIGMPKAEAALQEVLTLNKKYHLSQLDPAPLNKTDPYPHKLTKIGLLQQLEKGTEPESLRKVIEKHDEYNKAVSEDDFTRFQESMVVVVKQLEKRGILTEETLNVQPHLARVLTRIRWIDDFYRAFPRSLVHNKKVRTLTLESAYPRLLLMVPAADLPEVLNELMKTLCRKLFSSNLFIESGQEKPFEEARKEASMWLLRQVLPPVLLGAVVVFKVRQPLYQVLNAGRNLIQNLTREPKRGLRLGFLDFRSGLGMAAGSTKENSLTLSFGDLYELLQCLEQTDHRSLTGLTTASFYFGDQKMLSLNAALLHLIGVKKGWHNRVIGGLGRPEIFNGASFVKTVSKS